MTSRSKPFIALLALALLCLPAGASAAARPAQASPFDGSAMWIHELRKSSGGNPAAIVAQARRRGIVTVVMKASGGTTYWNQFSPAVVSALKAGGLKVCAYQRLFGERPAQEAALALRAVGAGADCLVMDAESEYANEYAEADAYIKAVRTGVGSSYPIGFTSFPYVDFHSSVPYSVFLGPGGAQYNLPQMYWKAIGDSVDEVYRHTYTWNRLYGRPIFPLGQAWQAPPPAQIRRFRSLAAAYGASGVSWWVWQLTSPRSFKAIGERPRPLRSRLPRLAHPTLRQGARGDVVVWAQRHLISAGHAVRVDGLFTPQMRAAVAAFQSARGLGASGALDHRTWTELLKAGPAPVNKGAAPARRP